MEFTHRKTSFMTNPPIFMNSLEWRYGSCVFFCSQVAHSPRLLLLCFFEFVAPEKHMLREVREIDVLLGRTISL